MIALNFLEKKLVLSNPHQSFSKASFHQPVFNVLVYHSNLPIYFPIFSKINALS